jgi:Flp pilus assembly pilin Flp
VSSRALRTKLRATEGVELRESAAGGSREPGAIRRPRPFQHVADHEGQALFEYTAIVSIVSIVAIGALTIIGGVVDVDLSQIAGAL